MSMSTNPEQAIEYHGVEESLSTYFQRSVAIVRQYADLIEQDYAQPLQRYVSLKFKEKPMTMTFISIFAGLAVFPLLSFAGLTVFILSSIAFVALASAGIVFLIIEAFLVACLVFMLWSLFIVASFATAVVFFVYWTMRLGLFVTREGPSGVTDWAHETRQYIFCSMKREVSDESDGSAVLVDKEGPITKKIKVEEEEPLNN